MTLNPVPCAIATYHRRFWRRNQTGDLITDHVMSCWNQGLEMHERAVLVNISRTNWTGAPGWRHDVYRQEEDAEPFWMYKPPDSCFVTWGEKKKKGVSRWELGLNPNP